MYTGYYMLLDSYNGDMDARYRPELIEEHDPRLIIVMLGGWDAFYAEDKGTDAYLEVIDDAVELLTVRGARILWLSMLPGPDTDTEEMDAIFRDLPEIYPGVVAYGDIADSLRGPKGDYPRWIPGDDGELILARKPDGWHVCPDGAVQIARVVGRVSAFLGLSPEVERGWEDGGWRDNQRYDDPPGGCDVEKAENAPPTEGR